jgi:thiol:disulfide interchange protein DsbA
MPLQGSKLCIRFVPIETMDRRHFSSAALLTAAISPLSVSAQELPFAGKHYVEVSPRQPTRDRKRVEVLEFFAYSCEHCLLFEPLLDAWQKRLPAGVLFRRIPVAFRDGPFVSHQKLYFAIEHLGLVDRLHGKVFAAMHLDRQRLDTPERIAEFGTRNGVAPSKLLDAFNSFTVASRAKEAHSLTIGYKVAGTPSLGVDGRWRTSGALTGSNERSLAVAEFLIGEAKRLL